MIKRSVSWLNRQILRSVIGLKNPDRSTPASNRCSLQHRQRTDALRYASNQTNRSPVQEWQRWEMFYHFPRCHRHRPASPEDSNTEMIISMACLCYLYHYQVSIEKGEDLLNGEIDAVKSSLQPLANGRHLKGLIFMTGCHVCRHIIQQLAMRFLFQHPVMFWVVTLPALLATASHAQAYIGCTAGRRLGAVTARLPSQTGTGHLYRDGRIARQLTDHLDLGHQ